MWLFKVMYFAACFKNALLNFSCNTSSFYLYFRVEDTDGLKIEKF
jgi:hypothetical protein